MLIFTFCLLIVAIVFAGVLIMSLKQEIDDLKLIIKHLGERIDYLADEVVKKDFELECKIDALYRFMELGYQRPHCRHESGLRFRQVVLSSSETFINFFKPFMSATIIKNVNKEK